MPVTMNHGFENHQSQSHDPYNYIISANRDASFFTSLHYSFSLKKFKSPNDQILS